MTDSLVSILTHESWFWDPFHSNEIKFHSDGTGDLLCRYETQTWIMAQFTWTLPKPTTTTTTTTKEPHLPINFPITLTLTQRRIPGSHIPQHVKINEALLIDEVFLPKTYTVRLEKGTFMTQHDVTYATKKWEAPRYSLRLVFDKSPYPPPAEWKEMSASLEAFKVWEWTEFCSGREEGSGVLGEMWGRCGGG